MLAQAVLQGSLVPSVPALSMVSLLPPAAELALVAKQMMPRIAGQKDLGYIP